MAVLTSEQLSSLRRECASRFSIVGYTKSQINTALQAIEDVMTTRLISAPDVGLRIPQLISAAIDSSSFSFTNPQKIYLFAIWAELKFNRDK